MDAGICNELRRTRSVRLDEARGEQFVFHVKPAAEIVNVQVYIIDGTVIPEDFQFVGQVPIAERNDSRKIQYERSYL